MRRFGGATNTHENTNKTTMIATENKTEKPDIKRILPHRLWNATLDVIERTNQFLHSYLIDGQLLGIENEYN